MQSCDEKTDNFRTDGCAVLLYQLAANELIIYEKPPTVLRAINGTNLYSSPRPLSPLDPVRAAAIAQAAGLVPIRSKSPPGPVSPILLASSVTSKIVETPGEGSGWAAGRINTPGRGSVHLPLPVLIEPVLPEPRHLTLHRRPAGDFGFSLRRSVVVERTSSNDSSPR